MKRRGLSLLEVVVSVVLLTMLTSAVIALYSGALAGMRKADDNQEALAKLETLNGMVGVWARGTPTGVTLDSVSLSRSGNLNGYEYQVEDLGSLADPSTPGGNLALKRVRVTLYYMRVRADHQEERASYADIVFVGR